jgi:dihydrofolate reductase
MTARTKINLILATGKNGEVGDNGTLPWKNPEELENFKSATYSHPIIYGRNTFISMGRVLPGRRNIIVSSQLKYIPGAEIAPSLQAAIDMVQGVPEAFVIGGVGLWTEALPIADAALISEIDFSGEVDTVLPKTFFVDLHALYEMKGFSDKGSFTVSYWQRTGSDFYGVEDVAVPA